MSDVLIEKRDGVLRLTMNRPDKKNALTGPMYDTMTAALKAAERDDAVRAILLEGAGGSFTAGNDLGDFLAVAQGKGQSRAFPFIEAVALLEKPIVAAVDGVAVGVGVDRDRRDAHLVERADDPAGDLAAVGNQNFVKHSCEIPYIRKMPYDGSASGARDAAPSASPSTMRVSSGSMIPSSHSRAVE